MKRFICLLAVLALSISACDRSTPVAVDDEVQSVTAPMFSASQDADEPDWLAMLQAVNEQLEAQGSNIRAEAIEFFTFGLGRPSVRILQQPFRWVANDARRFAQGTDITYMVVPSGTASGVLAAQTGPELDAAMTTWDNEKALSKVSAANSRAFPGGDVTIFDGDFGLGSFCPIADVAGPGFPFAADIVHAGWYPAQCFGFGTLAFSVTFIFAGGDSNGDGYLDTALNEVYFNDAWGNPGLPAGDPRVNFPWNTGAMALPNIDIQTVALHESGHSLELGHFGPKPAAVMNPVYAGPRLSPFPIDHAGMAVVWQGWPK